MYIDNWVPKARGFGSDRPTHLRGHIFWNFSSLHKHFWACYIHKNIKKYKKYTFFGRVWLIVQWTPLRFFPALLFEQWSVTTCRSTWPKSWVDQTWILDIPTKTIHVQVVFLLVNICEFVRTYIVMVIWKILGFISRVGI